MDNATGTWYSAWLAFRSPMVGSINAPEPGFRPGVRWGWCHGGVLRSVGRSEASPSTPALPGRGPGPGSFLSVVRSGERPRWQHPLPGALEGQGHMDIRERPIGGLSRTAMGVTLALVPCPRYGVSASLWCRAFRFWAVIPPRRRGSRRPVLAQTAATLQVSTPPRVLGGFAGKRARI